MRHPEAIQQVREYVSELGGFEKPKTAKKVSGKKIAAGEAAVSAVSAIADSLKEGSLCEIVQIMDLPVDLAPGHAIALIKSVEASEAGEGLVLSIGGASASVGDGAVSEAVSSARTVEASVEFIPETSWTPIEDITTDYKYNLVEMKDCVGKKVKMIQQSADPGKAEGAASWRDKTDDRDELLENVKTSLHYWYGEGFGSERRKKPA